jgi:hypothetical protein
VLGKASNIDCEALLQAGQRHIDHVEAKAGKAVADFRALEAEFARYRSSGWCGPRISVARRRRQL